MHIIYTSDEEPYRLTLKPHFYFTSFALQNIKHLYILYQPKKNLMRINIPVQNNTGWLILCTCRENQKKLLSPHLWDLSWKKVIFPKEWAFLGMLLPRSRWFIRSGILHWSFWRVGTSLINSVCPIRGHTGLAKCTQSDGSFLESTFITYNTLV